MAEGVMKVIIQKAEDVVSGQKGNTFEGKSVSF